MVKPTNLSVLGLMAAWHGPSESMDHLGLVLEVRYPFWTSPMPTGVLKCQMRLFHDAGYLVVLMWGLEMQSRVWTRKSNS